MLKNLHTICLFGSVSLKTSLLEDMIWLWPGSLMNHALGLHVESVLSLSDPGNHEASSVFPHLSNIRWPRALLRKMSEKLSGALGNTELIYKHTILFLG